MLKCNICKILFRKCHMQKEFWEKRAFSSATFSDRAELPLCEVKVSVSSAVLRFCSPLHRGFRSSWGSLHSRKSGVSSVLLRVKWADHRGAGVVTSGKRYPNLTWLLPTGSGCKLTWVFSLVEASRGVPWISEPGKEETWAWLALDSTAQCGAGSQGHGPLWPCCSLSFPHPGLGVVCGQHPCRNTL